MIFRVSNDDQIISTYSDKNEISQHITLQINKKYCLDLVDGSDIVSWINFYVDENNYVWIKKVYFEKGEKLLRPFYLHYINACELHILKSHIYNKLNYFHDGIEYSSDEEYTFSSY